MNNVLHNLVYEVNLPAVQAGIVQVLRKRLLCRVHVNPDDFSHELAQRLLPILGLIVLLGADFTPKNFLQCLYIFRGQGDIAFELGNHHIVHMLPHIEFCFSLVVLKVIIFQI